MLICPVSQGCSEFTPPFELRFGNAITNVNNPSIIKISSDSISTLSKRFVTSTKTIYKINLLVIYNIDVTILMHTYQSKNENNRELGDSTSKIKTPMDEIEKWHQLNPEIFKVNPAILKQNLINLQQQNIQVLVTSL